MPSSDRATRRKRLLLPALLLLAALALGEGLLRAYFLLAPPQNINLLPAGKSRLHIFEPAEGSSFYSVKPNYRQKVVNHEFSVEVRTNNIGLREDTDYHGEHVDIAFVGDSFTFGWGVEAGERYSDIVAAAFPARRVLSYAYPNGHAPINYLGYLQAHPEMIPDILVMGLFAFNDLAADTADAIVQRDPQSGRVLAVDSNRYGVNESGFIHDRENPLPAALSWAGLARMTAIGRTLRVAKHQLVGAGGQAVKPSELKPLDRGVFDPTALRALGHIREIDALARAHNSMFLVFYIPFSSDVADYPVCRYVAEICDAQRRQNRLGEALASWARDNRIHFLDPLIRFRKLEASGERLYFPRDAHWNRAGHAAAGELIVEYLGLHAMDSLMAEQ